MALVAIVFVGTKAVGVAASMSLLAGLPRTRPFGTSRGVTGGVGFTPVSGLDGRKATGDGLVGRGGGGGGCTLRAVKITLGLAMGGTDR